MKKIVSAFLVLFVTATSGVAAPRHSFEQQRPIRGEQHARNFQQQRQEQPIRYRQPQQYQQNRKDIKRNDQQNYRPMPIKPGYQPQQYQQNRKDIKRNDQQNYRPMPIKPGYQPQQYNRQHPYPKLPVPPQRYEKQSYQHNYVHKNYRYMPYNHYRKQPGYYHIEHNNYYYAPRYPVYFERRSSRYGDLIGAELAAAILGGILISSVNQPQVVYNQTVYQQPVYQDTYPQQNYTYADQMPNGTDAAPTDAEIEETLRYSAYEQCSYLVQAIAQYGPMQALAETEKYWKEQNYSTRIDKFSDILTLRVSGMSEYMTLDYTINLTTRTAEAKFMDKQNGYIAKYELPIDSTQQPASSVTYHSQSAPMQTSSVAQNFLGFSIAPGKHSKEGYMIVENVSTSSQAYAAGLRNGASLVKIDTYPTVKRSVEQLYAYVENRAKGNHAVTIYFSANGKVKSTRIK